MTLSVALSHTFGGFDLDVAFEAPTGVTALYGRSGSGKSTIVNAVAGLFRAQTARIFVDEELVEDSEVRAFVPPHKRRIGYVFQDARLFPHLSVRQNLNYGAWASGTKVSPAERDRLVEMLGLGPLLNRRPVGLSGGEKQRVAIGRALMSDPKVLLADEPLASLDQARKSEILPYFEQLRDAGNVPILYVSHAPEEVARLATTVIALEAGRVIGQGPAREVLSDPTVTPTGVGGVGSVLEAKVVRHHSDMLTQLDAGGATLYLPHVAQDSGAAIRVRLPASDVMLSTVRPEGLSALNIIAGTVSALHEASGSAVLVSVDTVAGTILSRITNRSAKAMGLGVGTPVFAIVKTIAIAAHG